MLKTVFTIVCLTLSASAFADLRIWNSETTADGALGGRAGADSICQADGGRPADPSLNQVRAFISISASDEIRDMPTLYSVPIGEAVYRDDGTTVVAADFAALLNTNSVALTNSVTSMLGATAWTGSNADGSLGVNACSGYTSVIGDGVAGFPSDSNSNYLAVGDIGCNFTESLYCLAWSAPPAPATAATSQAVPANLPWQLAMIFVGLGLAVWKRLHHKR